MIIVFSSQDCYEFLTEGATDNVQMWQVRNETIKQN